MLPNDQNLKTFLRTSTSNMKVDTNKLARKFNIKNHTKNQIFVSYLIIN